MAFFLITLCILILSFFCLAVMVLKFMQQPSSPLSFSQYVKLMCSGVIAFIADTVGVGSFAVNVALAKLLGTFRDDELPAVNNGAQVLLALSNLYFSYTW